MPAGMRVLGEAERQEMLDALSRSKHDIEAQLLAMPFVLETPSQVHITDMHQIICTQRGDKRRDAQAEQVWAKAGQRSGPHRVSLFVRVEPDVNIWPICVVCEPLQVHHKKKLEERLAEVEQALRIFSQRRVLVKSDDAV